MGFLSSIPVVDTYDAQPAFDLGINGLDGNPANVSDAGVGLGLAGIALIVVGAMTGESVLYILGGLLLVAVLASTVGV